MEVPDRSGWKTPPTSHLVLVCPQGRASVCKNEPNPRPGPTLLPPLLQPCWRSILLAARVTAALLDELLLSGMDISSTRN